MFGGRDYKMELEHEKMLNESLTKRMDRLSEKLARVLQLIPTEHRYHNGLVDYSEGAMIAAIERYIKYQEAEISRLQNRLDEYQKQEIQEFEEAYAQDQKVRELRQLLSEGVIPPDKKEEVKDRIYNHYADLLKG